MKKRFKLFAAIISFSMMLTSFIPASADDVMFMETSKQAFINNGHGEYILVSVSTNSIDSNNDIEIVYANTIEQGYCYIMADGKYLINAYNDIYQLSDRIEVDVENFSSNSEELNRYNVSEDLRFEIQSIINEQKSIGNDELEIEIFAPSINQTSSLAGEDTTQYYTYTLDGVTYDMKDYSVKFSNLHTGFISKTDQEALSTAKAFVNFVVSCAGTQSKIVSAFSTVAGISQSAYDVYKSIHGEVRGAQYGDMIETNLIWDKLIKETYCADPIYGDFPNAGCITYKVWLNRHDTYQFYQDTGEGFLVQPSLNKIMYSPLFNNPCPEAIANGIHTSYVDKWLYTTVFDTKVQLT